MRGYDFQGFAYGYAAAHAVWSLHFFITPVALLMPGSSTADLQANNIGKAFKIEAKYFYLAASAPRYL